MSADGPELEFAKTCTSPSTQASCVSPTLKTAFSSPRPDITYLTLWPSPLLHPFPRLPFSAFPSPSKKSKSSTLQHLAPSASTSTTLRPCRPLTSIFIGTKASSSPPSGPPSAPSSAQSPPEEKTCRVCALISSQDRGIVVREGDERGGGVP